jgi:DNA-directed RNA polymerase II subunit RPB2
MSFSELKSFYGELTPYLEEPFEILESYFAGKPLQRLVRHQIESYNHFIGCQIQRTIDMFNPVVIHSEKDFVEEQNQYFLEIFVTFTNFRIYEPQIHENNGATKIMTPQEARLRNFTYASNTTIDLNIRYVIRDTEDMATPKIIEKVIPHINIGKIPIMLKSDICVLKNASLSVQYGECPYDCGGYFIIKGSEKTVLGQERASENKIYCFNGKNTAKWTWYAEIKSVPDFKCISPKQIEMMIANKNNGYGFSLYITIPRIKQPIELFALFRAFGILTDKEICEYIVLDIECEKTREILNFLKASIIEGNKYRTYEDAFQHIVSMVAYTPPLNMDKEQGQIKKREFTLDVLNNDLFPHCQTTKQKLYLVGYMAKCLIETAKGWRPPDDRDSYVNKRIELTGTLLNNLYRNYFNKVVKEMQKLTIREINSRTSRTIQDYENILNMTNIYKLVKHATIENGIIRALSTGDFSIKQANSSKVGVGQVLNRLTYPATISHLRRINTPLEKSGELIAPRKLHNTTWGFLCPVETPEGQSIGIVKNLAYMAHITIPTNSDSLYTNVKPFLQEIDKIEKSAELCGRVKVFVNGAWIGTCDDPLKLYQHMKQMKCTGRINIYTSIVFDYKLAEIRICSDGGRLTRPLLRMNEAGNRILMTRDILKQLNAKEIEWTDLLVNLRIKESVIEYIDVEEQGFAMIGLKEHHDETTMSNICYTHCEIHPSTILGILASCIPFPEHNQAPRNTYECAQMKQAMGVYATNFESRMDKTAYILTYPSRPLIDTRLMNMIGINRVPSGTQITVAIMTHTGYNQEDSLLLNRGSVDRGMFMTTIYHTEKDEDNNIIRDEIIRCKPDKSTTRGIKFGNYDKLNAQGFIPENTLVENRDIIIAKIIPIKENRNDPTKTIKYEDQSKVFRTTEESYIDRNYTGRNGDGYNFAKTRVRTLRKPVIGDKFSSKMGQKGTCGNIIDECNMPFTADGLRPDIILNPHAIPSRMTIGQLKETVFGKILLHLGMLGDGTAFGSFDIQSVGDLLSKCGYHSRGEEIMYDGVTGEQMEMSVFIGPVYYQRLKHMVNDKQHSRAIGPMVNLTRQPAEGRSRDGGFRVGEMERDVLLAHGMSHFCKERLFDVSDKYTTHVCKRCGLLASYYNGDNPRINRANGNFTVHSCNTCGNMTDFARIDIPFSFKLLSQELQTINVVPRLITE